MHRMKKILNIRTMQLTSGCLHEGKVLYLASSVGSPTKIGRRAKKGTDRKMELCGITHNHN
eukprot:1162125-Pelagomonas_calceolata.AAC.4